jgi:hypothetical protein
MGKEGYYKYQPTFINELNDDVKDVWWQAFATSLHSFLTLVPCYNIMFIVECAVCLSARPPNEHVCPPIEANSIDWTHQSRCT